MTRVTRHWLRSVRDAGSDSNHIGTASETECEIASRIQVGVVVAFKHNFLLTTILKSTHR